MFLFTIQRKKTFFGYESNGKGHRVLLLCVILKDFVMPNKVSLSHDTKVMPNVKVDNRVYA